MITTFYAPGPSGIRRRDLTSSRGGIKVIQPALRNEQMADFSGANAHCFFRVPYTWQGEPEVVLFDLENRDADENPVSLETSSAAPWSRDRPNGGRIGPAGRGGHSHGWRVFRRPE